MKSTSSKTSSASRPGAALQFEFGLFGLQGFSGDLSALQKQRRVFGWSLRLCALQEEVTDEELQALPQRPELGNSRNPTGGGRQEGALTLKFTFITLIHKILCEMSV